MASSAETGLRLREQDLVGKVALVTGASRGIGRAIALNLASRGCSILGTCSKTGSLHLIDTISHSISGVYRGTSAQPPQIVSLVADILDPTAPYTICQALERQFESSLDIHVNSAAMLESAKMGELTDEHIQNYMTGNLEFPVKCVNEFVKRKFFRKNSRIILISSLRGRLGWGKQYIYIFPTFIIPC